MENNYNINESLLRTMLQNAYIQGCLVFMDTDKYLEPDQRNKLIKENQEQTINFLINIINPIKQ